MGYDSVNNRIYLHDNGVSFFAIDCAVNTIDTSMMAGQGGGPVDYNPVNNKIYHLDRYSTRYSLSMPPRMPMSRSPER